MTALQTRHPLDWIKAFGPAVVWALLIFILSAQSQLPGLDFSSADFFFKKIAHMTVYGVLYYLLIRGLRQTLHQRYQHQFWWWGLALCLLYAGTDELHQSFVAHRHSSLRDVGYDMLGATVVMLRLNRYI